MFLLVALLLIPIATAFLLLLLGGPAHQGSARWIALGGALLALFAAVAVAQDYYRQAAEKRADGVVQAMASPINPPVEYQYEWLKVSRPATDVTADRSFSLEFRLGLDGISVAMLLLTAILTVSSVLISWQTIRGRAAEFFVALLFLEAGLFGVFCAFDLVLFYVFFEFTLIPLFFLIAIWGGPQRRLASIKFFLYTFAGSVVTLLGLVMLVSTAASAGLSTPASLPDLAAWFTLHPLDHQTQITLLLMLSAGLLIKVPVFPFHTWLPLAHVEAPTAGSVLLAGVLLKLGTYGFLRICLPLLPAACVSVGLPLIAILSVIGIIYGSLCALAQRDIKKLVAYSSIAHMGFCMLGLFALNVEGLTGGVLQMINHGLSTGGLFLLVGMVYDRYHTRMLDDLGGLASRLPMIACSFVFISMASIGLPGLNGFVGEFLSLAGMFRTHPLYAVLGTTGVILGAWYLLTMLQHLLFGPLKEPTHDRHGHATAPAVRDMGLREMLALAPIALGCLWIGVRPQPVVDSIKTEIAAIAALYEGKVESLATADGRSPLAVIAASNEEGR
jgi:NADH-quinone oxidoreductase subunit M